MKSGEYPEDDILKSDLVLVVEATQHYSSYAIAVYKKSEYDADPIWESQCSEGWTLNHVVAWMPLPPYPEISHD
jgi:hypothetical protein